MLQMGLRTHWLGILLLLAATVVGCDNSKVPTLPVVQGEVNLSEWQPQEESALSLNGDWAFFWNELVAPESIAARWENAPTIHVPGAWNTETTSDGITPSAHGHATYALKLTGLDRVPKDLPLGMVFPPIATAIKVWLVTGAGPENIHLILQRGRVDAENPTPQWSPETVQLPRSQSDAYLVIQVVNQHFWLGGIFYPSVSISDSAKLERWFDGLSFLSMIVLGFIFMMALYHFGLFLLRRQDRASLLFSMFCAIMFVQSVAYRHWLTIIWLHEATELNFLIELLLMSVGSYLGLALSVTFVSHLFPNDFPKRFTQITWLICGSLLLVTTGLGPVKGSELTPAFLIVLGLLGIPLIFFLARAALRDRLGARWVLAGFLALAAGTLHDVLAVQQLWNGSMILTPFGLLGFFFAQSVLLSKRNAMAHAQAEHLSENLQDEVEQRTRELEIKTLEAMEATQVALGAQSELEEANQRLLKLDQQKTSFFQSISHELRTPLTLILGPLEEALRENPNDTHSQVAVRNGRRLLRLVNQLLDFQKIQAGRKSYRLNLVDLGDFVANCEAHVATACSAKKITFRVENANPHDSLRARVEFDGLEKICFNFLANALKFTSEGGTIVLGIDATDTSVRIFVRDTGPGISSENQDKLFKLFSQVGDAADTQGTGLGLALAKELATGMSGKVGVESEVGAGSTFWVELPRSFDPSPVESLEDALDLELSNEVISEPTGEFSAVPSDNAATILVVDDLKDMRSLIARYLTRAGYRVVQATQGTSALESARAHHPNLLITDWMMPDMDGPALLQAWRADPDLSGIPAIMLTARSDGDSRVESSAVGADGFIGKPFQERELLAVVRNLLALKENERKLANAYQELEATSTREIRHASNLVKQTEKLATLGQLVASVGHEIANPVSLVQLAGDEQKDHLDSLEEAILNLFASQPEHLQVQTKMVERVDELRENLSHVCIAGERLRELSLALRTQSRHEEEPSEVVLADLVEESLLIVRGKLRLYNISSDIPELPNVFCIRSQIGQVLVNLFSNAGDAIAQQAKDSENENIRFRGRIEVSASPADHENVSGILVRVRDNGAGIPVALAESIFEPFVTTKPAGVGTGLGLMLSRRIMEEHKGYLKLDLEHPEGTAFTMWLPS